ncbi:enoyl-CoA hydratase/isomerase family protein [uncultured Arthrobacter sp.]|uniref:enoyl-CoA hydratase/isomerase family protein n=1 Tax=uncultured Arthrobacter sp. TaxID=114050 RepID=UPI0026299B93|nr:enoyl-CoA hydratase-related protein [uncultured Arthrobacter sp.]
MQFPAYTTLLTDIRDKVLTITVNRPDALNALSSRVIEDLDHCLAAVSEVLTNDDGAWPVRGVIITGAGKAFVAGADIREMTAMTPEEAHAYSSRMHQVTLTIEQLPVPVIAAVNGFALGGGCELAMACDLVYAASTASFGQPEVSLGLVPGFGGSVRLPQYVGPGLARELLFTGRRLDAGEAKSAGLVTALFDTAQDLLDGAHSTLALVARQSPAAVALVKKTLSVTQGKPTAEGLAIEAEAFREAFTTEDKAEGTRAFLAKERPNFPGR